MPHDYLSFSNSTNYPGFLVVGTSEFTSNCNGLTDTSVKNVRIPSIFEGKIIAEIGHGAFVGARIESVFIPKTVRLLGESSFNYCNVLKIVKFEKGSELEKIERNSFYQNWALAKIDIPPSLKIFGENPNYPIFYQTSLSCVSYFGSSNFTSSNLFNRNPIIHVSKYYPFPTIGGKNVTKDGKTCGVSNFKIDVCSVNNRCKLSSNHIIFMILVAVS